MPLVEKRRVTNHPMFITGVLCCPAKIIDNANQIRVKVVCNWIYPGDESSKHRAEMRSAFRHLADGGFPVSGVLRRHRANRLDKARRSRSAPKLEYRQSAGVSANPCFYRVDVDVVHVGGVVVIVANCELQVSAPADTACAPGRRGEQVGMPMAQVHCADGAGSS